MKSLQQLKPSARTGIGSFVGMGHRLLVLLSGVFLLVVVLSIVGYLLCGSLAKSDFFLITETGIKGCRMTTKRQILDLAGIDVHSNLLALDVKEVKKQIEAQEWIKQVVIRRDFPNRLLISVRERIPVALVNLAAGLYYLDHEAVCFAPALPPEDMDFPVVSADGLDIIDCNGVSNDHKAEGLREALRFIGQAGRGNAVLPRQNISEVRLQENGNLILFLMDHPIPIYLGKGEMRTKYDKLVKVLSWLYRKNRFDSITAIKVDYMENKVLATKKITN